MICILAFVGLAAARVNSFRVLQVVFINHQPSSCRPYKSDHDLDLASLALASMASNLAALPGEILELVAASLELTSLRLLRTACKEINRKTFHYFCLCCFTIVRTDLSRKSLRKLAHISDEQPLREYIHTLLIDIHPKGYEDFQTEFPWHRASSGSLKAPIPGAQIVQDILAGKLVHCRSFRIQGYAHMPALDEPDHIAPSDIVGLLVVIVANASLPVKSLVIDFHYSGWEDPKPLHLPLHQRPGFTSGWAHLQELFVGIPISPSDFEWVGHLISRAPILRKLSLMFQYRSPFSFIESILSGHGLKELQSFNLTSMFVTTKQILELLSCSCESLRELSLHRITIDSGDTWENMIEGLKSHFLALNSISFFYLQERPLGQSAYIWFSALGEDHKVPRTEETASPRWACHLLQPEGLPIKLSYEKYCGEVVVAGISYHGSNVGTFLDILAQSIERDRRIWW